MQDLDLAVDSISTASLGRCVLAAALGVRVFRVYFGKGAHCTALDRICSSVMYMALHMWILFQSALHCCTVAALLSPA